MTKLKNSKCCSQNLKCEERKKSKCDKNLNVTKLKNSKCEQSQKIKM